MVGLEIGYLQFTDEHGKVWRLEKVPDEPSFSEVRAMMVGG